MLVFLLLGKEREGMKIMFQMMNDFRMGTAVQAQGVSSAAYLHAASYSKGRLQGSALKDMNNPSAPMVPIIEHPDVQRMLLWIKSYVDAQRMLIYNMYYNMDLGTVLEGEEARKRVQLLISLFLFAKPGAATETCSSHLRQCRCSVDTDSAAITPLNR